MLPTGEQVLVVDDETNLRRVLAAQLTRAGYEVHTAEDGRAGLDFLQEHYVDVMITDLRMPRMGGMDLLRAAMRHDPKLPVIVLTAHATVDSAVEALKSGAFDYLTKPHDQTELGMIVAKALRTRALEGENASAQSPVGAASETPHRFGIIGSSAPIQELYALIDRVADTPTTAFITGESGTGKELVARALHEQSSRRDKAFIKVNCAAIPATLIEAELFGHVRGAFTSAVADKPGRFELASGGTLFLDEIGEIPIEMQVKLLRVLQERELERVGGVKTIKVDVRLITATNRDLKKEVAEGRFREDLYYRLNVVPLALPPLRERVGDIPELVGYFLEKFNERLNKNLDGVEPDAMAKLQQHAWPGNIRELENVMERAVLFADQSHVAVGDLPAELRDGAAARSPQGGVGESLGDALEAGEGLKEQVKAVTSRVERELIVRALDQTGGNVTHAARLLKISRKGLQLKMKELELRERDGG